MKVKLVQSWWSVFFFLLGCVIGKSNAQVVRDEMSYGANWHQAWTHPLNLWLVKSPRRCGQCGRMHNPEHAFHGEFCSWDCEQIATVYYEQWRTGR